MDANFFQNAASATLSDQFHPELVSHEELRLLMDAAIQSLRDLDAVKASLFYGKKFSAVFEGGEQPVSPQNGVTPVILHCVLGAATETGEMLEGLYKSMFEGKPLDVVNLKEEIGDNSWFLANLCNELQTTLCGVFGRTIGKLQQRFGEKFTAFYALNRDLPAEREVLEAAS